MAKFDFLKNKTWRLFSIALLFAFMAGFGTIIFLKTLEHRIEKQLTPKEQQMSHVVVANRDLNAGSKVSTGNMAVREIPSTYVPKDAITPKQFDQLTGAVISKDLEHGKMLTMEHIALNIAKDFSATIQDGHRAITISVDDLKSISGLLRPGNHVDIFTRLGAGTAQGTNRNSQNGDIIVPVLENVLVLATGKRGARPNEDEFLHLQQIEKKHTYSTITLELSPENAALLSLARAEGELIAVLRNKQDTSGILFSKMSLSDLFNNSDKLQQESIQKLHNRSADLVHLNKDGKLVTRDGIEIKDPNVHLNKDGLLVTKDGVVLSGRGLHVNSKGQVVDENGKPVDTASLVAGKDGTIVDKNGNVLDSNGYHSAKGGFLVDKDGNVYTHDGHLLKGVHVDKHGNVVTKDGQILKAKDLTFSKDGSVRLLPPAVDGVHVGKDGKLLNKDGKPITMADLVTVDKDGTVRTKDGKIIPGVHMGKDGKLYDKNGHEVKPKDLVTIDKDGVVRYKDNTVQPTVHIGTNGKLLNKDGKPVTAADLVTVDKNGIVRTKNGKILPGVHMGKDGKLYDKNGHEVKPEDLVTVGKDGVVRYKNSAEQPAVHVGENGELLNKDGKPVTAADLVTVGKDGVVRTKDGKILPGVHMGKDGKLYDKNGKVLNAKDILLASKGYKEGKNGTVVDANGKVYTAKDLTTVDPDGTVRTKDGKILKGVYRDKNGVLRNADGSVLTAKDVLAQSAAQDIQAATQQGTTLAGVTSQYSPDFAKSIGAKAENQDKIQKEIEFIIGGGTDGNAKSFKVPVEEKRQQLPAFNEGEILTGGSGDGNAKSSKLDTHQKTNNKPVK